MSAVEKGTRCLSYRLLHDRENGTQMNADENPSSLTYAYAQYETGSAGDSVSSPTPTLPLLTFVRRGRERKPPRRPASLPIPIDCQERKGEEATTSPASLCAHPYEMSEEGMTSKRPTMSRSLRGKTSTVTVLKACRLRHPLTASEQILWKALRDSRLQGVKFRRQHPFGPYILDFFCVKAQLAVELDGSVHEQDEQEEYDRERTAYLEQCGLRVLRFKNQEVERNVEDVLDRILEAASPTPQPPPSPDVPSGEGGGAEVGGG
jgi:very-short-patch-repair endonuclease